LAIKYNYDSSVAFSRAFKQYFNVTPTECRNNLKKYKLLPIIEFHNDNNMYDNFNYEIKNVQEKTLYCYGVSAASYDDILFKIRELYNKIKNNGIREKLKKVGMYGISIFDDNEYKYYVGSELKLDDTETVIIDKGTYAVFEVGNGEQKDIVKVYDYIYGRWIKSTNYEILDKPEIEFYENNNCYIYISIKDKQN
jgi:predicted transcriptional regulator YdeE